MTLCPLEHDPPVIARNVVCEDHERRTRRALNDLPKIHTQLATILQPHTTNNTGKITTTPSPGLALDPRVVQCRTDIDTILRAWTGPDITCQWNTIPEPTIPGRATWLRLRLPILLRAHYAPAFVLDITSPFETANRLLDPNPTRVFPVGPCPVCDGTLIAQLRPADPLLPAHVTCNTSPLTETGEPEHSWTADRWLILGRMIRNRPQHQAAT